jgi:hypothetical protein
MTSCCQQGLRGDAARTVVHIFPRNIDGCGITREDHILAKKTWRCRHCSLLRPDARKIDIRLNDEYTSLDRSVTYYTSAELGLV